MTIGYLTPDSTGTGTICRSLFIPNDEGFIAVVTGALDALTIPESWQKQGLLTPEEAAGALRQMFDDFCFDKGRCRMVGEIIPFAGAANPDPDRWLPCDGSLYAVADYPDLYAVIDVFYGGIPFVNFNVPDLRGRIPLGAGHGTGLTDRPLATTGGEETHTLIEAEIPSHTHTTGNSLLIATATPPPLDVLGPNPLPASTGSTGGDGPHENMPPWLAINYFIASKP